MNDRHVREEAARARTNVVVTAGAGAGKTTLLVNTVLARILEHGIDVRRILMLTFTEKAANEMRIRLDEELRRQPDSERVRLALEWLGRAQISTIHGFCAHILREFPVEAGIDPSFVVDEGQHFGPIFEREWERWLQEELGPQAPRRDVWKRILSATRLYQVRQVAEILCDFHIPEWALRAEEARARGRAELDQIRSDVAKELEHLMPRCGRPLNNLLDQMRKLAHFLRSGGELAEMKLSQDQRGWLPEDFRAASQATSDALALARDIAAIDEERAGLVLDVLGDFVRRFRAAYAAEGFISFDGLLTLTHELLTSKTFSSIRARVRERFDFILVDEFQDTDPVQCDIILRLAEHDSGRLVPGRLFIVGDPKQSIYSFRGADIVAYERVKKRMLKEGAREFVVRTNFRSHAGILSVVNAIFRHIIRPLRELQPAYEPIEAAPDREAPPGPSVELVLFDKEAGRILSEESRRAEAEYIARWIRHYKRPYRDFAILLKALTDAHVYLEALREHAIPYVVEGEKFFYGTIEVVDCVNLLRAIADPNDRIALAGVLRSPLGAVDDRTLYDLKQAGALDYREQPKDKRLARLYAELRRLRAVAAERSVPELIDEIFRTTFVLELAASSYSGEQALVNLHKIRDKAAESEAAGLRPFLRLIRESIRTMEDEGESPLADETLDAVRVMSIHKSKGLEFPVVVLPDLHREASGRKDEPAARYDWPSRTLGIRLGDRVDAGAAALAYHEAQRRREEEKRVPYVALTRAKERMLLLGSAGFSKASLLGMLARGISAAGGPSIEAYTGTVTMTEASFELYRELWREPERRERAIVEVAPPEEEWGALADRWRRRVEEYEKALGSPRFTSPSRQQEQLHVVPAEEEEAMAAAAHVGTLCHRALERMDFERPEIVLAEKGPEADEARAILESFLKSRAFAELAKAEILARELPFVMRKGEVVWNGVIDLVYRSGGKLWVADYKSDLEEHPEQYAVQKQAYLEAVERVLGERPGGFRLVYLRHGRIVSA